MRVGGKRLEIDRIHIVQGLDGPQGRSSPVRRISLPPEFDPRTFQPVPVWKSKLDYTVHKYLKVNCRVFV